MATMVVCRPHLTLRGCDCRPMDILLLLIPLSVVLVLLVGAGFWWAVKSGQFDDLEGPAHRILADDDSGGVVPASRSGMDQDEDGQNGLTSVNLPTDRPL
jgi:cbb3-type cytochrome oxidase maturation protein